MALYESLSFSQFHNNESDALPVFGGNIGNHLFNIIYPIFNHKTFNQNSLAYMCQQKIRIVVHNKLSEQLPFNQMEPHEIMKLQLGYGYFEWLMYTHSARYIRYMHSIPTSQQLVVDCDNDIEEQESIDYDYSSLYILPQGQTSDYISTYNNRFFLG